MSILKKISRKKRGADPKKRPDKIDFFPETQAIYHHLLALFYFFYSGSNQRKKIIIHSYGGRLD
jgi:hypothetical protein